MTDFSGGLISDLEAAKIPANAASSLFNADIRNGFLNTLPGISEVNTGLPTGFVKLAEEQFVFTHPSEKNCTLVYGTLAGVHKLYIKPHLSFEGTWIDAWQDLTEIEMDMVADAGTTTTRIVDAGLASAVDDYYNGWIVIAEGATAIVKDYDGATRTLELSWAISGLDEGSAYIISRNPVFDRDGNSLFSPSIGIKTNNGCRFIKVGNTVEILTGGDRIYDSNFSPCKTDLHLSVLYEYRAFNDNNLNWSGFYLTRRPPVPLRNVDAITNLAFEEVGPTGMNLTADEGTTSYHIIDSELPSAIEDYYVGWLVTANDQSSLVTGYRAAEKKLVLSWFISGLTNGTPYYLENPLDAGTKGIPTPTNGENYGVLITAVYDGYQESPLFEGDLPPYDGTKYSTIGNRFAPHVVTNGKLKIDLSINYGYTASMNVPLVVPNKFGEDATGASVRPYPIFDRRITALRIYMAEVDSVGTNIYTPVSEWRLVKEVKINSDDWSGSGPSYARTVYVFGNDWSASAGIDISDRLGHQSIKVFGNSDYGASSFYRTVFGNVYTEEPHPGFVFSSPTNSDGLNTPSVLPHTLFLNLADYGITRIMGIVEVDGFFVVASEKNIVRIKARDFTIDANTQHAGCSSSNAFIAVNKQVYLADLNDCYVYHPELNFVRSIMAGHVREAWRSIPTANKEAAAIGYDGRYNMLCIAAGNTIYTYNLPRPVVSDLGRDLQAIGSWQIYSVNRTFIRFYTDLSQRCIGIADDGKTYELFSPEVENTVIYEKVLGEGDLNLHTLRMVYNAPNSVTVKIFDTTRSSVHPVCTFLFPAQSKHKRYDHHKSAHVKRPMLQITAPLNTKISEIIINFDLLTDLR